MSNLYLEHVQLDEIWTFVGKKQGRLTDEEKNDPTIGDIYVFTALDTDTKLMASFAIGKRTSETTEALIADLEKRMIRPPVDQGDQRPQLSTDGFHAYPTEIDKAFGGSARHGMAC